MARAPNVPDRKIIDACRTTARSRDFLQGFSDAREFGAQGLEGDSGGGEVSSLALLFHDLRDLAQAGGAEVAAAALDGVGGAAEQSGVLAGEGQFDLGDAGGHVQDKQVDEFAEERRVLRVEGTKILDGLGIDDGGGGGIHGIPG